MKVTKYAAVWHEENDSGVPEHCMGMSPLFDTGDEALAWIKAAVAEDRERFEEFMQAAKDNDVEICDSFDFYEDVGSDLYRSSGNNQTTYYKIVDVDVESDSIGHCKPQASLKEQMAKEYACLRT